MKNIKRDHLSVNTMNIPKRKMSAQNVMASITRTLGTRHETNTKASNEVIFAGEESKDKLYEPKHQQKAFRVMTVIAYMISVSLAAIILSLYYSLIWDPKDHRQFSIRQQKLNNTIKVDCVNPTLINQLVDISKSDVTLDTGDDDNDDKKLYKSDNSIFLEKLKTSYSSLIEPDDTINDSTSNSFFNTSPTSPSLDDDEDFSDDLNHQSDDDFDRDTIPH